MDYENNNEALAIVKRMVADGQVSQDVAEKYFPELKESEDERVRKKVIDVLKLNVRGAESQMQASRGVDRTFEVHACNKVIAWLEKQDFNYTFEIKKGHWYKCVCDYMLNDSDLMFKNDRLYYCRSDWRLTGEIDERNVKNIGVNGYKSFFRPATNQEIKDWLEKQDEQKNKINSCKFTYEDVLALECSMKTAKITKGGDQLYKILVPLYNKIHNAYLDEIQGKKKPTIVDIMKNYFATTSKEQQNKDWEELKHLNDIGPDIEIVFGTKDSKLEGKQGEKKPAFDVEIPFGAKDSELIEATYIIPKGFHAEIIGDEVHIIKQGEKPQGKSAVEVANEEKIDNQNCVKPVDKIKPKFHEGDWITCDGLNTALIVNIDGDKYEVEVIDGTKGFPHIAYVDNNFHLWTIQDAKDGDILFIGIDGSTCIFKKVEGNLLYSYITFDGKSFVEDSNYHYETFDNVHPATKEQNDFLFSKMHEARYEWNAYEKELNKIEPKFKIGVWIVDKSGFVQQVLDFRGGIYTCTYNSFTTDCESNYHLWTIQDAKDGDVLTYNDSKNNVWVCIFKKYANERVYDYCTLDKESFWERDNWNHLASFSYTPATKEQREQLEKAMADAGYTFDFDKKELKEIEKNSIIPKFKVGDVIKDTEDGEVFTIKTITKDKYIYTDDGFDWIKDQDGYELVEQKSVIIPKFKVGDKIQYKKYTYTIKEVQEDCYVLDNDKVLTFNAQDVWELIEQNLVWSEEDEKIINNIGEYLNCYGNYIVESNEEKARDVYKSVDFLKSLKDRVQPQPKQEWSEEDEKEYRRVEYAIMKVFGGDAYLIGWIRKFKNILLPQTTWKPSDEQLNNILDVLSFDNCTSKRRELLESLYQDLKKLREGKL